MSANVESLKTMIVDRYVRMTPKSAQYTEKARSYLPGGDTRSAAFYRPYPFCADKGAGCRLTDVDGNSYLDFGNNFTSLIHGHAHPKVVAAIVEQAGRGTAHGTPVEQQYLLSKLLCERIPDIDLVRYCNSASEAVMYAMRAARLYTKKDAFVRIDGGYNGCTDYAEVNVTPDFMGEGMPRVIAEPGVPGNTTLDTYVVPYNDLDAAEKILKENADRIAGVILEPMLGTGGLVVAEDGYLAGLRKLADQYNVLLVFDETITLRFHTGGMHTLKNVRADIVATGKIIGGGLPVGAFAARKEIMDRFNPEREDFVSHSGTFSGNALTMAAGYASMQLLTQSEIDRINGLGDRLRKGFADTLAEAGIPGVANGFGSVAGVIFSQRPLRNAKDVVLSVYKKREMLNYLFLCMLSRGINYVSRGMYSISTTMREAEVDRAIAAFKESIEEIMPLINDIIE